MSPRRPPIVLPGGARPGAEEWIGGVAELSASVEEAGESFRPEAMLWVSSEGAILGCELARPGRLTPMAGECLQRTIDEPMHGRPRAPARVRVASPELAEVLQAGHPGLDVVCAPTPELDAIFKMLGERVAADEGPEPTYLSPDTPPDEMAWLFEAAAALFRARPWNVVPDDECLLSVTIEDLEVRDWVLSVLGQAGESFGFALFRSLDDFDLFLGGVADIEAGEEPDLPPHLLVNYLRARDLAPSLRREISENRWKVIGAKAYPWIARIEAGPVASPPDRREVTMLGAIATALTGLLAEAKDVLAEAWAGDEPISRTMMVRTPEGKLDVVLRAPARHAVDEIGEEARRAFDDDLLHRFAEAPEAKDLVEIDFSGLVMALASEHFGRSIRTLQANHLREILFEIIPREVSVPPSDARPLVVELRALFAFLEREYRLEQAAACLKVLGGDAAERFEAALADPANYGMAKSVFMAGVEAGFDMGTEEGIEAWMASIQGQPAPAPGRKPKNPPPAGKNKRKAPRKPRKKRR